MKAFPVQLSRINQAVDPVVKTVLGRSLHLDNRSYALKHHQSATLHLQLNQNAMAIPDRRYSIAKANLQMSLF